MTLVELSAIKYIWFHFPRWNLLFLLVCVCFILSVSYFPNKFYLNRLTHAMGSTVTTSLQTRPTNQRCGLKPGLDGTFSCLSPLIGTNSCICTTYLRIIGNNSSWVSSHYTWSVLFCRYTEFGGAVPSRPAEDLAFSVARFIQKGGSFINYYMVRLFSGSY